MKSLIKMLAVCLLLAAPAFAKPPPAKPKVPFGTKADPVSDDPIENKIIAGEYATKGQYRPDHKGFVNHDLQKILQKYAQLEKVDVGAQHATSGATKMGSGDLEMGVAAGIPTWLSAFQHSAAASTTWGVKQAVESKLMGAFYYRYFRKLYAEHNAKSNDEKWALPVSVEYMLQHLGKSLSHQQYARASGNGMADFQTIGGGGANYCAAASGQAMKHGFANYGLKMGPVGYAREHGFKMLHASVPGGKAFDLKPGDVCSIRSLTGPESGHVVTVAFPVNMDGLNSGTMWVVSGNAMLASVAADFLTVEHVKGKRPSQGKIMILNCTSDSEVHLAHWKGEDLTRFKVTKSGDSKPPPDYPTAQTEHAKG